MGATEQIAEFIVKTTYEDIPQQAITSAKRSALDTIGCALAGWADPGSKIMAHYVKHMEGKPEASVIGGGFRTAAPHAAMVNGYLSHVLDYDDCGIKVGHPSALILPAILALAEPAGASGREILTAYIIGLEVQGKIALNADLGPGEQSLDRQNFYGCLGAGAAAAKILRLDVASTRTALGLAANTACGLRANRGTMMDAMSAGNACGSGVTAARLARLGATASPDILEAKHGFCYALAGPDGFALDAVVKKLGNPFYIVSPGIGLKKYPSCYHTHRAVDALFQLMEEYRLRYEDVAAVEIGTSERALRVLSFPEPATPHQGKFSMPYVIGCALLDGKVTLGTFSEEKMQDPNVRDAQKKVQVTITKLPIWPGLSALEPDTEFVGNPVTIRTRDGQLHTARVDTLRGDPEAPLSDREVLNKYADCAAAAISPETIRQTGELLLNLEKAQDIHSLMKLLRKAGR